MGIAYCILQKNNIGFMPDKGTRNAIFILRMLSERAIEMQKDLFVCFIDYEKAFDNVRHAQLFQDFGRIRIRHKGSAFFE